MKKPHFLVLCFPIQSHINPSLQFSKRLLQNGATVTFVTCKSTSRRMIKGPVPEGLNFATISDGYDDNYENIVIGDDYLSKLRQHGTETLTQLIRNCANDGTPVHNFVFTLAQPWAIKVARSHNLPCTCLWVQPATTLAIYYYYVRGYGDVITKGCRDGDPASWSLELPHLPYHLKINDLPSFVLPSNTIKSAVPDFQEQLELVDTDKRKIIFLVNTFDALEPQTLKSVDKYTMAGVGPLLPSAFLDGRDPSDNCFGAELFERPKDYMKWLESKPESSVVYISFGSLSVFSKKQMQAMASALLECGRPFLWVIRDPKDKKTPGQVEVDTEEDQKLEIMEDQLAQKGLIVPWCSQVEVLSHPSVGCFVTHCGWNSTLESLTSGVPMVALPQWGDQPTNAMLIEDVWRTGVRVNHRVMQEEATVVSKEIARCLKIVMEDEDIKMNAKKWRELAIEAVKEGGSSDKNFKAFMQEAIWAREECEVEK